MKIEIKPSLHYYDFHLQNMYIIHGGGEGEHIRFGFGDQLLIAN